MFRRMRRVLLVVSFSVLVSACSPQTQCLDTCAGCCSPAGVCSAGTTDSECGKAGAECAACTTGKSCSAGVCRSPAMGGGGGTTGGGGGVAGGGTGGGTTGGGGGTGAGTGGGTTGGAAGGGTTGGGGGTTGGGGGTTGGGGGPTGGGGGPTGGGGGAGGGSATDGGSDAGIDAGVPVPNPRLFVTRGSFNGDLQTSGRSTNPLVAGDTICNDAAADAGLGGVWRAMIAVGIDSPFTRLNPGAPYRLVGSATQVFRTAMRLAQVPEVPINRNEFGQVVPVSPVWTATDRTGINNAVSCIDWNSAAASEPGSVGFTSDAGAWTGTDIRMCDSLARLYCFEF